jgi:hypothetical protein
VKLQACKLKMLTVNLGKFHTLGKYTTPVNKMETIIFERGMRCRDGVPERLFKS